MLVVEVGFLLKGSFRKYKKILYNHGLKIDFKCKTHDLYYTNSDLNNLSEKGMKDKCIRVRCVNNGDYEVQNDLGVTTKNEILKKDFKEFEKELLNKGYKKVFDTKKKDYHFYKDGMSTKVQLQDTKDIGLLVFLDNKEYYKYNLDKQRNLLIDELNSYGFDFKYEDLGLDKLRTLYYKKRMYSKNQND